MVKMIIARWATFKILFIFLFPWIVHASFIHNLDVKKERVFTSLPKSYFGYSLSAHRLTETPAEWLVGSPGENLFQGAVYKCNTSVDLEAGFLCKKVRIISSLSAERITLEPVKNGWFGATVVSNREFALLCSPRAGSQAEGECFTSENNLQSFSKVKLFLPRRVCLSGFSATYMTGSLKPLLGGPTCLKDDKPNDVASLLYPAAYPFLDKWYLGYAMASGTYGMRKFGQEFLLASVAFHINSSFAGKVYMLNKDTKKEIESLVGYQPGEHFGASLAVSDFTGDGRDDIVVGAPHHTDYNGTELKVEIGAVYIYYQTSKNTFDSQDRPQELRGLTSGSRFGYTVAAIGDTNADGFNDLAIGAPYENDGLGTVYLYQGSENGLRDNPQIISGNMFSPHLKTFGFSIAGGDFDGNKYSDVIIGAYESAAVVYIPARPIAKITSDLNFVSKIIKLQETSKCSITNSTDGVTTIPVACEDISFCITYSGSSVEKEMEFRVSIVLDFNAEKDNSRILFLENNRNQLFRELNFTSGSKKCLTNTIYAIPGIQDFASTAQAKMTIEPVDKTKKPNRLLPIFSKENSNIISTNSLTFMIDSKANAVVDAIPWWVYVASGLGAFLILAIITGILYKLGFFERKKPPTQQTDGEELTKADDSQKETNS